MSQRIWLTSGLVLALSLGVLSRSVEVSAHHYIPTQAECEAMGKKMTICHATSSQTNPYNEITISCNALYGNNGNAGHFDENGTPHAGHEDDWVPHDGQTCSGATATPTPTPAPTATPTPSATPEPTSTPQSTPDPNSTPSPTPTATPQIGGTSALGRRSSLGTDGVSCHHDNFDAVMDVFDNTQPIENALVRFTYGQSVQESRTNNLGRARANFAYQGSGQVIATTDGFPSQSISVGQLSCPATNGSTHTGSGSSSSNGSNSGSGSVLGVSSLANTGWLSLLTLPAVLTAIIGVASLAWQVRRQPSV
jgi:hypothetical protein